MASMEPKVSDAAAEISELLLETPMEPERMPATLAELVMGPVDEGGVLMLKEPGGVCVGGVANPELPVLLGGECVGVGRCKCGGMLEMTPRRSGAWRRVMVRMRKLPCAE
mgnify:CR=1 FL=1